MRHGVIVGVLLLFFGMPILAHAAASSCTCFCGTSGSGAVQQDGTYTDANACIADCREQGSNPVGCFTSEDQFPEHSELCWTEEQCTQNSSQNTWDNAVPNCDDRKEPMGYCYAAPKSITTIVGIGDTNTFSSLPDYISTLYKYLVPVMAIVAIVMVMIAGLQYILSRGNPSAVKQAKERMVNAVIGLVLLMSAYTLARLLDPRLVEFTQLRVPKVKQVVLLSPGTSCETLALAGIEVDNVPGESFVDKTCTYETGGTWGVVTDVANVRDEVDIGAWKEGDKCTYSKCGTGETCTSSGCLKCAEAAVTTSGITVDTGDATATSVLNDSRIAFAPSAQNCSLLTDKSGGTEGDNYYCVYTAGGSANTPAEVSWSIPPTSTFLPECVGVPLECTSVLSDALAIISAGGDGCTVYGELDESQVVMPLFGWTNIVADFIVNDIKVKDYAAIDPTVYKTVCNADPCGIWVIQGKKCGLSTTESTVSCVGQ